MEKPDLSAFLVESVFSTLWLHTFVTSDTMSEGFLVCVRYPSIRCFEHLCIPVTYFNAFAGFSWFHTVVCR